MTTFLLLGFLAGASPDADAAAALALARAARERTPVQSQADADAAPTPQSEIARVLALLPKPTIGFVDFGCGADARWCIAAAQRWGCRVTGVEIDPTRAAAAKECVRAAGLGNLVTIVEGDAITTDVQADVGVAYLWPDVLAKLKSRLEKLAAFASYMHRPPVAATQNGDTWIYLRPQPVALQQVTAAAWGGQLYSRPLCNSPYCAMCNAIRAQLATAPQQASSGHYVKHCSGGNCWYEWVADPELSLSPESSTSMVGNNSVPAESVPSYPTCGPGGCSSSSGRIGLFGRWRN